MDANASSKSAHGRIGLGFKDDGIQALCYCRPSLLEFAADCTVGGIKAGEAKLNSREPRPDPSGMSLAKVKDQISLALSEANAIRFRRAYGYLGGDRLLPG